MTFRVGQKVVCVDDSISRLSRILRWALRYPWNLRRGEVYTIQSLASDFYGESTLVLVEAKNPPVEDRGFFARRFRPVANRKTDISFAHEILRKTKRGVHA